MSVIFWLLFKIKSTLISTLMDSLGSTYSVTLCGRSNVCNYL